MSHLALFLHKGIPHQQRSRENRVKNQFLRGLETNSSPLILEPSDNVQFLRLYSCHCDELSFWCLLRTICNFVPNKSHPSTLPHETCVHWCLTLGTESQFLSRRLFSFQVTSHGTATVMRWLHTSTF